MVVSTANAKAAVEQASADLQTIVRRFGSQLIQSRRLSSTHRKALWSIANCRTPIMGGHVEHCRQCRFTRYQYHSCRNRHCPGCQFQASDLWREARAGELLPVPYFHHVFTLPHKLNPWILRSERNYRELIKLLFRAAAETLLQFGRHEFGGQLGFTMVLHTWDQRLKPHFHVHCLVPSGALCDKGTRWAAGGRTFLFSVRALSKTFRAKYLDGLRQLIADSEIDIPERDQSITEIVRRGNVKRLSKHFRGPWVVYAQKPFAGPKKLLGYLSRYVHRTAISNDRIQAIEGDQVRFTYRDRADGDRQKSETIPAEEFLSRFLHHVLPRGLTRIRHYGFLSNRTKKANLIRCRELLAAKAPDVPESQSLAEWFMELIGLDIKACPNCGDQLLRSEIPRIPMSVDIRLNWGHHSTESIDSS
jgi:hypothetical protein